MEEVVKSIGTNSEESESDGDEEGDEEMLLLVAVVSDWVAGTEYCRLMNDVV